MSARSEARPDSPIGRALPLLLPALVHRLNNALTSIQLVLELDTAPGSRERAIALEDARTMRSILLQLAALVEVRDGERELDLGALVRSVGRFLAPMAERAGIALEVRVPGGAQPARVPAAFEALLTAHLAERIAAGRDPRARLTRLRLGLRSSASRVRLCVTTDAPAAPVPPLPGATRERAGRGARSLVMSLEPLGLPGRDGHDAKPERGLCVLLLQRDRERRALVEELLRQRGHRVVADTAVPAEPRFDVVLADADLAPVAPALLEELRAHPTLRDARIIAVGRWERGAEGLSVLDAAPRPARLLEAVERS